MSFKLPKLVNTRCSLAPSVKAVKDVATSITITWKSFLDHLLQIMSKRKWDVPNQESIFKVFIDKCETFLSNRLYRKLNWCFKSLKPVTFLVILHVLVLVVQFANSLLFRSFMHIAFSVIYHIYIAIQVHNENRGMNNWR